MKSVKSVVSFQLEKDFLSQLDKAEIEREKEKKKMSASFG